MPDSAPAYVPIRRAERFSRLGLFVARHRRGLVLRKLAGLCKRYVAWYENVSYDLGTNGETFVLETLAPFRPRVLFDVGANIGEWTRAARERCSEAEIHAFEIAAPTFKILEANTQRLPGVFCRNVGLSDVAGAVRIRHYSEFPALTTSTDYPHPFASTEMMAEVETGDEYAARHGIEHIDLLKMDVEGMEGQVLKGFQRLFARNAIDLVQFEYGRVSIVNRFLLRDFYDFFHERGYVVGKVFPNYVDFRDYDMADEDFLGPNYLACREVTAYREAFCGVAAPGTLPRPTVKSSTGCSGDPFEPRTP